MAAVDICNRALSEMGKSIVISSLDDPGPAATQCKLHYNAIRQQLIRAAPWGFTRKTVTLSTLGTLAENPPTAPYPWLMKYAYPADCIKMRYILPPPVWAEGLQDSEVPDTSPGNALLVPWCSPSRQWRYLVAFDDTVVPARRVVLANVPQAWGVYSADVTDTNLFDPLFQDALAMALAWKLVIPLSGNVKMKQDFYGFASQAVASARAADGNEAIPSTDHSVDWITTRDIGAGWGYATSFNGITPGLASTGLGEWYSGYDNSAWSM